VSGKRRKKRPEKGAPTVPSTPVHPFVTTPNILLMIPSILLTTLSLSGPFAPFASSSASRSFLHSTGPPLPPSRKSCARDSTRSEGERDEGGRRKRQRRRYCWRARTRGTTSRSVGGGKEGVEARVSESVGGGGERKLDGGRGRRKAEMWARGEVIDGGGAGGEGDHHERRELRIALNSVSAGRYCTRKGQHEEHKMTEKRAN
jgi:hypothetical protein